MPKTSRKILRSNLSHNGTCLALSMIIVTGVSLPILLCGPGWWPVTYLMRVSNINVICCTVMVFKGGRTMLIHLERLPNCRIGARWTQTTPSTLPRTCHPQVCPWHRHHRLHPAVGISIQVRIALHPSHASRSMVATSAAMHQPQPQSILDSAQKAISQPK